MTDEQSDHGFDLENMNRDPSDSDLRDLADEELVSLLEDLECGKGTADLYDRTKTEIARRFKSRHRG